MEFWNRFAAKHPETAKWVREGGLFVIVSNLITVFKYLLLQFLPKAFASLPVVDFGWPGIPVTLFGETFQWNILGYDAAHGGLRFFTVYGPAGRPDMAYFGFTNKLVNGETIKIFNYGNCKRDFTYIDDIVEGVVRVMKKPPEKKTGEDGLPIPPYAVYNIGNSNPENLLDFVQILSEELVRAGVLPADYDFDAHKELVPMQPGDVPVTYADTTALERDFGFKPHTPLREGLRKFAEWYKEFYIA